MKTRSKLSIAEIKPPVMACAAVRVLLASNDNDSNPSPGWDRFAFRN